MPRSGSAAGTIVLLHVLSLGVRESDLKVRTSDRTSAGLCRCAAPRPARELLRKEVLDLTTVAHESSGALPERQRLVSRVLVHEMWASLAIAVMWLAVLFDALFGPDLVVSNASGTTTIPSAVIVAFFAYLATRVVARYGFRRAGDTD